MAIDVDDATVVQNTFASTVLLEIAKPTGTASGDIWLISVDSATDHTGSVLKQDEVTSAGFTEIVHSTAGADGFTWWYRICDGTEETSVKVSFSGSESGVYSSYRVTGAAASSPVSVVSSGTSGDSDGNADSTDALETPAILPPEDNCLIIGSFHRDDAGTPTSEPVAGYTELVDVLGSLGEHLVTSYKIQTTATSESVRANSSVTGTYGSHIVSIKPAAGGTDATVTASVGIILLASGTHTPQVGSSIPGGPGILVLASGTHTPSVGSAIGGGPGIILLTAGVNAPGGDASPITGVIDYLPMRGIGPS